MATTNFGAQPAHVICLVVDRLSTGYIGAYGNTWIHTPEFDRLATRSLLFDQAIIDSPRLADLYQSYWHGVHAVTGKSKSPNVDLVQACKDAGRQTWLLTDEPEVARLAEPHPFDHREQLDTLLDAQTAADAAATSLARFFAAATQRIGQIAEPTFFWLHTRGLGAPWDAPLEYRNQYAAEEDPAPPLSAAVPCRRLPEDYDPDELLGVVQSYAGQVTLLDTCLGALLDALDELETAREALLIVLGARGFPLGEHLSVGPAEDDDGEALFAELVQVPMLMRLPDAAVMAWRSSALVQPPDVQGTLLAWLGRLPSGHGPTMLDLANRQADEIRDRATVRAGGKQRAIRTSAWYLRRRDDDASLGQLYAKPDDRWEINDVAERCPDIVEKLKTAFEQFRTAEGDQPLDDDLRSWVQ